MEFDSLCQYSDDDIELSQDEHGTKYSEATDYSYSTAQENQPSFLEAKIIYILMPKNVPISRAKRLQWLLDNLNTVIPIPTLEKINEHSYKLQIISAVPREQNQTKCNRFQITYRTELKFLAHSYKFVYCLDMSPSQSCIDILKGEVLFDEILNCFKASVASLVEEFTVPNNPIVFQPIIYLTVMVNTPFFMSPAQQVLVKGVQLTHNNLNEIITYIEEQFHLLEGKIADVAALALDHMEFQTVQNERITGGLFDLPDSEKYNSKVPMVTPDANFVNMLRYSMLAASLLPENCLSHILVITDGIVAMPDSNIMESLLFQLHYDSVAVSFLKVGSTFQPFSSAGYVSYVDLLYFLAHSTLGTCIEVAPVTKNDPSTSMNVYQELFMLWSFHSINKYAYPKNHDNKWCSTHEFFSSHKPPSLLSKRQTDENTSASLLLLLSRRMREGFTIDSISLVNGNLEVKLSLQWKSFIYIHYKVSSQWPVVNKNHTRFEVFVSAPYEFLHDITCMLKKDTKSLYRQAIIERFWIRLSQLSSGDFTLAQQMSLFQFNKDWYTLPESARNKIPVYTLNNSVYSDGCKLSLTPRDDLCQKFVNIWQPICQMETNSWRRWLHVHKVSLILKHDNPLPKYLHLPSSSQRFQIVQCRQAATALYKMLAEWATFVLIDNHTYLRIIYKEKDKPPLAFCIVRVTSKFPCAVLNIGFTTGTSGRIRYEMCEALKSELSRLSYLATAVKTRDSTCCILLQKPLEKILIRYERIPNNFTTVIFPDGTQPPHTSISVPSPATGSLFTTLSRYLYHKRWIWSASHTSNSKLTDTAIARILNTITRIRIKEGFSFAVSSSGIITMVMELWMDPYSSCVVQYVLFPPHYACWYNNDELCSGSEEDNDQSSEIEAEKQIVTEVWIEPQYGKVQPSNPRIGYLSDKHYYEIADVISRIDLKCINALLTMEHLSLMCQDKNKESTLANSATNDVSYNRMNLNTSRKSYPRRSSRNSFYDSPSIPDMGSPWYPAITPRIEHIPFKFDPISILPLCHQTELLFSMFIESKDRTQSSYGNYQTSNHILLENIVEHLGMLHNEELELSRDDSNRFTEQILVRHKHNCPITGYQLPGNDDDILYQSQWRCFVKGISVTHVILTFIPSTLNNLKLLVSTDNTNIPNLNESNSTDERASSRCSNYSDVPINTANSICLPIYVFDCPLGSLVNAYINNYEDIVASDDDVYEDHRFKANNGFEEECIRLKEEGSDGTDSKTDEAESPEHSSVKQHCRTLVLSHSKCFTISLFISLHCGVYVHSYDVQSAMDQCEESITEIDITEYLMTVCGHVKNHTDNQIDIQQLHQALPCSELKSLHMLIKEKFFRMLNVYFNVVPSNTEFYYYRGNNIQKPEDAPIDSDDELPANSSEFIVEFKYDPECSMYSEGPHLFRRLESSVSDYIHNYNVSPLFLHLICTLRYTNGHSNTSVRVLPTCLGELIQNLDSSTSEIDKTKLQITLDILCLTLPIDVQSVIADYSNKGLRTTSFCSDGFQPSISSTISDTSYTSDIPEPLINLPDHQKKAIILLRDEIKWLLKDEVATASLDIEPISIETLNFILRHVTEGTEGKTGRSSCKREIISLNFVFAFEQSHERFMDEFAKIELPRYKLCKEDELYYLTKSEDFNTLKPNILQTSFNRPYLNGEFLSNHEATVNISSLFQTPSENFELNGGVEELGSMQSLISSVSARDTDGGYDEDVSEDYDDYEWLTTWNNKRAHLPNFWMITKIDNRNVTVYFHCRFLELPTMHVREYMEIQRDVCEAIRNLCKKVNQLLLLQSLYEKRTCDQLLEQDDSNRDNNSLSHMSRNASFYQMRSHEDTSDETEPMVTVPLSEASLKFKAGYFSCPVIWETEFDLNPRLKSGSGKSGVSRGISALKTILDKFSVSNRNNMFVYRDNNFNVFYLRLHENVAKTIANNRPNEFESSIVSRSPSIASLPLGQKSTLNQSEQSIASAISGDIRPRVRSFGEKESKDGPCEDTIILRVHGITDAGQDVKHDLVQVLQNRLDDAVLDFLSVMLARNAMCPLTPSDVQFIQKPFRGPEFMLKFTVQDYALQHIDAFIHYLKQNLLQFLNIPKYTDSRSHFHFKDYSESDDSTNSRIGRDSIFIYNQSQNPSSGNRGIACIALALTYTFNKMSAINLENYFDNIFKSRQYASTVDSTLVEENLPESYLEFRVWKQGRVNIENLSQKLRAAVSQATWDIVTEYFLVKAPLCKENFLPEVYSNKPVDITTLDLSREIEFNCVFDLSTVKNVRKDVCNLKRKSDATFIPCKRNRRVCIPPNSRVSQSITFDVEKDLASFKRRTQPRPVIFNNSLELGDDGKLDDIYAKFLPEWLEFGYNLNAPAVKKYQINLISRHLPTTTIIELLSLLQDTPKAFRGIPTECLISESDDIYVPQKLHNRTTVSPNWGQKYIIISRDFNQWKTSKLIEGDTEYSESLIPNSLKHTQKFVPAVTSSGFVPRQKILWILVESDNITIYTYNWAKDYIDKLITTCSNLGQWLSVRSCFLNSVTSQKMGLFHNQPLTRKSFMMGNNPYAAYLGDASLIREFPRDSSRGRSQSPHNIPLTLEAFRDNFRTCKSSTLDPVVVFTKEMKGMKIMGDRAREEMKILHSMYQSRTSTTTVPQIFLLMQNSRILHYCHTPLLFLPRWRLKSAATRDHSLYPSQAIQIADKVACEEKELWHTKLCYGFFTDYRNYLQTLGFMALQIDHPQRKNSQRKISLWNNDKSSYKSIFYIQKTILGGILLFTVEFHEPFFISKLHAIECSRLQNINSRASINRFTVSFLDECDRVKILMHLHSFTYDYHLRCIYNYISNNHVVNKVAERYNIHQFLDDFLKYYNKAPNFARNLVHTDTVTIKNLATEGKQLYDYLLLNVDQYKFKVYEMDINEGEPPEYILVHVTSTQQLSYKDSQDRHHTDDFDITLVVYNLCSPYNPTDNILHLKYYLILTSKREIYPKSEVEHKLGKFRTVSSTARSLSGLERTPGELEASTTKTEASDTDNEITSSDDHLTTSSPEDHAGDHMETSIVQPSTSVPHVEIYQESVNYLGYYSSHEQLMQQLILDRANSTQKQIQEMVTKGMVHCRTHLLWNRLISPQESALNYDEFMELKGLAKLEHLCDLHPNLRPLLNQPLNWYQGLAKLLLTKYVDQNRSFISSDGNIQHFVILHPRYFGAFMLLSMDLHTARGELYAVFREPHKQEDADLCLAYQKSLLDGFVNCICFYLWSGMIQT